MASPETTAAAPVLVVEDERPLAQIVADYLAKVGYGTVQVHTGPDGVTAARDLDPDLVILDLGLPGLDGVEVCREIRTFSDCYIIMVTARDDEIDKLIGLGVGADDYITKPFSRASSPPGCRRCSPAPADRFPGIRRRFAGTFR